MAQMSKALILPRLASLHKASVVAPSRLRGWNAHLQRLPIHDRPSRLSSVASASPSRAPARQQPELLSPLQVNNILREHEFTLSLSGLNHEGLGSLVGLHSNQLPSNTPSEDRRAAAICLFGPGALIGVFDGHGGPACAQAVSQRLFPYVSAALLPQRTLEELEVAADAGDPVPDLVSWLGPVGEVPGRQWAEKRAWSLRTFWQELLDLETGEGLPPHEALVTAFKRLDLDISLEAQVHSETAGQSRLARRVAFSGCTACMAYVDGTDLYIANTGDSRAVLGMRTANGTWLAQSLTNDHSAQNERELVRLQAEHPMKECDTVVKQGRLLGLLMPFRAFGDVRFKWSLELQKRVFEESGLHSGVAAQPYLFIPDYHTPPYLTAEPEITYHQLGPQDRFVVIATDGLWEVLHRQDVVRLVGEHFDQAPAIPAPPPNPSVCSLTLGDMLQQLKARREAGQNPTGGDRNSATMLVRHTVGRDDWGGVDPQRLARSLSLPEDLTRVYRDDITVTVIYLDPSGFNRQQ
uniref:pyruvate dehydrogenase [acetyl-transferring]-phosphatase 1, mitochondrial-like isoform X1 n=1 Tax=Myxine glutinosa TaxID=7769 RepID=UPI0035902386